MTEAELYYDEISSTYDNIFDIVYFRIYDVITWRFLEPYVPSCSEALLLDAGGGTGRWDIRMARKGCRVVLLDSSEGMLRIAREKVRKEGLQRRITIEKGDIQKLKYEDETYNLVLCEHTLFAQEAPALTVKEFARVLKEKSPLIISAQNLYVQLLMHLPVKEIPQREKLDEVHEILHRKRYDTMTKSGKVRIHTWTTDEFRNLLEANGFKVERIIGKGVTTPLRMTEEVYMKKQCPEDLLDKITQLELALCERPDAFALAGHLQAIARKAS